MAHVHKNSFHNRIQALASLVAINQNQLDHLSHSSDSVNFDTNKVSFFFYGIRNDNIILTGKIGHFEKTKFFLLAIFR